RRAQAAGGLRPRPGAVRAHPPPGRDRPRRPPEADHRGRTPAQYRAAPPRGLRAALLPPGRRRGRRARELVTRRAAPIGAATVRERGPLPHGRGSVTTQGAGRNITRSWRLMTTPGWASVRGPMA